MGGTATVLEYNASGSLVKETAGADVTYYLWNADEMLGRVDLPGVGTILSVRESGASRFLHTDAQGTTRKVTDAAQALAASYDLDAFGVLRSHAGSYSTPYLFTGKERDPGPGLDCFIARSYNPATGGFVSRDPYWPRELAYVSANAGPLSRRDPDGRQPGAEFPYACTGTPPGGTAIR